MVGRPISFDVQRVPYDGSGPVKLGLKNICLKKKGRSVLTDISLECRAGEILGIAGVEGNGQTELIEVVTGIENHFTGQVCCGSQPVSAISPRRMLDYVGHIPEERGKRGFVKGFSNWENLILGYHYRPEYVKHGFLNIRRIKQVARDTIKQFDVRTDGIDQLTSSLSGGNQQKLIIGRTLLHQSNIIVAAQPTRGVDIGAIEYIHQHLMQMRDSGSAILLISADLDEVIKLADRIAVLYEAESWPKRRPAHLPKQNWAIICWEAMPGRRQQTMIKYLKSRTMAFTLISFLISLVLAGIIIAAAGYSPVEAYSAMLGGAFGSTYTWPRLPAQPFP